MILFISVYICFFWMHRKKSFAYHRGFQVQAGTLSITVSFFVFFPLFATHGSNRQIAHFRKKQKQFSKNKFAKTQSIKNDNSQKNETKKIEKKNSNNTKKTEK